MNASIDSHVHWVLLITWWLVKTMIEGAMLTTKAIFIKFVVKSWGGRGVKILREEGCDCRGAIIPRNKRIKMEVKQVPNNVEI